MKRILIATSLLILFGAVALTEEPALAAGPREGIDRAVTRGGLDLDEEEDDDDGAYKAVDEKWAAQQDAVRRARRAMASESAAHEDDFFHQDVEDNRFKVDSTTIHKNPGAGNSASRRDSIARERSGPND